MMTEVLSSVWLRILEVSLQVMPSTSGQGISYTVPETVFASHETGKMLRHLLIDIYAKYTKFLKYKNANCIALWHMLNVSLAANLSVFEFAAGCNGADSARSALGDIAAWSETHYARRACLHAAGTFTAMSRRRISDDTMFHSEVALFNSALVLGLYVFMMPNHVSGNMDREPYELLDDVDWLSLELDLPVLGSSDAETFGNPMPGSDAQRFLWEGGTISFSGTICEGGYNAAKMVLLEYATLLEEVGKFNAKRLCHILRIMSDSLLDIDDWPSDSG